MTSTIHLSGVTKLYGSLTAVSDVSLDLEGGQTVALVGHNGAGKTTLLKLMLGLTRPSNGVIRVLGTDPLAPDGREARLSIGYLPENVVFSGALTGLETLRFYARLKRRDAAECKPLLERVGLGAAAGRRVSTYSKGMRQRLGLAQAVLGEPRLLFLDEPTTGLDPLVRQGFYNLVSELRDRGVTSILSSHALSELEARIDQVVIMHRGTVAASGSLDALRGLAGLPVRLRLVVTRDYQSQVIYKLAALAATTIAGDDTVEITCDGARKMELIRRIASIPQVLDLMVMEPSLDEIYASFLTHRDNHDRSAQEKAA